MLWWWELHFSAHTSGAEGAIQPLQLGRYFSAHTSGAEGALQPLQLGRYLTSVYLNPIRVSL